MWCIHIEYSSTPLGLRVFHRAFVHSLSAPVAGSTVGIMLMSSFQTSNKLGALNIFPTQSQSEANHSNNKIGDVRHCHK